MAFFTAVREIIQLVDYLLVQADKPWYNYYVFWQYDMLSIFSVMVKKTTHV